MFRTVFSAATLAASVALEPANADEVYAVFDAVDDTFVGHLIYETALGGTAVWITDDGGARFYVQGLGGVVRDRAAYEGVMIEYVDTDARPCGPEPMTDHEGNPSFFWGEVVMVWDTDESWIMEIATCNEPHPITVVGRPI